MLWGIFPVMDIQESHEICEHASTSTIPPLTHTNPEVSASLETVPCQLQTPPRQLAEESDVATLIFSPITPMAAA